jgi:lipid-A-disaccharide synthase
MRLGLLAGEASGDILGASVIGAMQQRHGGLEITGIGGPLMAVNGLTSLYPMDRLSVMGLVEPLKRLPELLSIRSAVFRQQCQWQPHCFLGIDSPDFNLPLERRLRGVGLRTAHLVSPSVWAWRPGRIKSIAESVDLMLCLLPFEVPIYARADIPAVCVGHPLIEELSQLPSKALARQQLGLPANEPVLAVLPGSRSGEVANLMPVFLATIRQLQRSHANLTVVIPAASADRKAQLEGLMGEADGSIVVTDGGGRLAMQASDSVLLASGTASLEAMLLRRPMVIAYRMAWLSWQILSRMAITPFAGLPNILAGREVVPELLQEAVRVETLVSEVEFALERGQETQVVAFEPLLDAIGGDFANRCADALEHVMVRRR